MTFVSILYFILAILGLSFLIFIHELGHYFMARRVGMRVETFSIGFGKPIYKWMKDGVNWQIGWLLFGGYVKITGMEMSDEKNIYEVKGGFFSKRPLDRIKVAFAGPFVNIVFALLAFAVIWIAGGREKKFSEHTHKIGWIDPKSELFSKGIRPGDEISFYNDEPFSSVKDHLIAPMTSGEDIRVRGSRVDFRTKTKTPFDYTVKTYPRTESPGQGTMTAGILQPAAYLNYRIGLADRENPLFAASPIRQSGVQDGDRLIWVDGIPVYSVAQLNRVINDSKALLTVKRGEDVFLRRIPRVRVQELKLDREFKEELTDWQFEAGMNTTKFSQLFTIPYNLNNLCVVEAPVKFIEKEKEEEFFPKQSASLIDSALQPGDKILSVDGIPVTYSFEILSRLQQKHVNIIVQRDLKSDSAPSWRQADRSFDEQYRWEDLQALTSRIGISSGEIHSGNLYLLDSVVPKTHREMQASVKTEEELQNERADQKQEIENIEDPVKRAQLLQFLEQQDKQLLLGLSDIRDIQVNYNPNPFELFGTVADEIWQTLKGLFTGSLNPKWMSGPIGIVQVVHDRSMGGIKEAVFWLGAISLNLGILNLLPLPVLDGGTICLSLYEWITGRQLKAKTLERLIIPFAVLLIALFIFLTYHDLGRLFGG